jgi:hypothetical protein
LVIPSRRGNLESAILTTLAAAVLVALGVCFARRTLDPSPPPTLGVISHHEPFGPAYDRARDLRTAARYAMVEGRFADGLRCLDEATDLDPAGDSDRDTVSLRARLTTALGGMRPQVGAE